MGSQTDLFEDEAARSLLDELLENSRLYKSSKDYQDLLSFVVKLRNFAPFNAMLLQIQKPGLSYAASEWQWREQFRRYPKEGARPLLILWPFGPVALVYDVQDTDGEPLPEDVACFAARGAMDQVVLKGCANLLSKKNIHCTWVDAGDASAGSIRPVQHAQNVQGIIQYRIHINRNHAPAVQFATLAHELGHLALGHFGHDKKLDIPSRLGLTHAQEELEAESVAYIVCKRNGVTSKSQTYLSSYVSAETTIDALDVYQVMRAAGKVETLLGLAPTAQFERRPSAKRRRRRAAGAS